MKAMLEKTTSEEIGSPSPKRPKKLVRRAPKDYSQRLRRVVQLLFLALNVWIGIEFYLFVRYYETGGRSTFAGRPPGVEGWLPIASLMNLKVLLLTGRMPAMHTAGMFLLIAAVLPFPARWLAKLVGVAGGVFLMYALNQLRILALVVSLHWHREWFASVHGLIAPTFIVLGGCLFFFVWANAAGPHVRT